MSYSTPKQSVFNFNLKNGLLHCEAWIPGNAIGIIIVSNGTGILKVNKSVENLIQKLYHQKVVIIITQLLTPKELSEHKHRMDTELVSQRLITLIRLIKELPVFYSLPMSLLGIGTGADGVLITGARIPNDIMAVAAVNGHDMNAEHLKRLPNHLPTMVISQKTLGQEDQKNGISMPSNKNIQYQKVYRTDEVYPLAAMEEAMNWLAKQIVQKKSASIKIEHYELDPGRGNHHAFS